MKVSVIETRNVVKYFTGNGLNECKVIYRYVATAVEVCDTVSDFAANEAVCGAVSSSAHLYLCSHWLDSDRNFPTAQRVTSHTDSGFTQIK